MFSLVNIGYLQCLFKYRSRCWVVWWLARLFSILEDSEQIGKTRFEIGYIHFGVSQVRMRGYIAFLSLKILLTLFILMEYPIRIVKVKSFQTPELKEFKFLNLHDAYKNE